MAEHTQGRPGADRAVGRPGPVARMAGPDGDGRRPNVLITPVGPGPRSGGPQAPASAPAGSSAPARPAGLPADGPPPAGPAASSPRTAGKPSGETSSTARVSRPVAPTGPRSARLYLTHVDPWSVMKQAFLLSLAIAVIILASIATIWMILESAGVIAAITRTATDVGGESAQSVTSYLTLGKVMGLGLVVAGIETVLLTVLATLFAFLYNLSVGIGGGLEVTLSEED